jgi:hypothetical protein
MTLVITLIYHSRADEKSWVAEGSRLRATVTKAVRSELPGIAVVFEPFRWSGGNSPRSRLSAAAELQRHLRRVASNHRGAQHLLVAHSHGGNVALYALRDPETAREVRGLACFSTPFVHARPRDLGPLGGLILFLVLFGLWSALLIAGVRALPGDHDIHGALILLATGISFLSASFSYSSLLALARDRAARLAVQRVPVQLFLARVSGDDASRVTAISGVVSWALSAIWRRIGGLTHVFEWAGTLVRPRIRSSDLATAVSFLLGIALLPFCLLLGLLAASLGLVAALLGGLASTVLGPGYGATSLLLDISLEPCPVGNWMVHTFPSPNQWEPLDPTDSDAVGETDSTVVSRRDHSGACEHPDALRALAQWLVTTLRSSADREVSLTRAP